MRLLGSHAWRARATALLGAFALGTVAVQSAGAQSRETPPTGIERADGRTTAMPRRGGFNLFGSGDIATTGMKGVGAYSFSFTNYGPPLADLGGTFINFYPQVLRNGGWFNKYFEITLIAGAPRHEFRKIRNVYPGIGTFSTGNGYTALWNAPLLGGQGEIAPADNSLGTYFSGVQSTADGSCRDMTATVNEGIVAGSPLLAISDCPVTWGTAGFQGPRVVPDTAFRNLKAQLGDDFNWQYWRANPNEMGGLLGNFSTFGLMTDHTAEILDVYAGATPKGSGSAAIEGYPLGLDFRFEAASFSLPALANTYVYQVQVINRSEDVYGVGIDYDSLYAGLEIGFLDTPQRPNTYYEPGRNAVLSANGNINPACNGARRSGTDTPGCTTGAGTGFTRGSSSIVMLKSPIGDMRNKLYTRPGPFNDPSNPHRGDTITFNHGHKCGYGACIGPGSALESGTQPLFGLMSSTGQNVLAGRSVNDLTGVQYFYTFRNADYPIRNGTFNSFAPGLDKWDYNHDGVADTIYFDTCDESVNNTNNIARGRTTNCVSTWSDSTAGGFINQVGNVGGMMTAGPFALKAGDTTSFIIAFNGAPDSASIEAATNNAIEGYLNFWAGPTGPPNPTVVATNVTKNALTRAPTVLITYSDAPETWVDPFLTKYANDLQNSTAPDQVRLRTLNPNLVAAIRARAAAGKNFNALYVYKSCNGGTSFTSDADCIGDPAQDLNGNRLGNGWRPYQVIRADANGNIPNLFQDVNVVAGRTYLYSFVSQSRGFTTTVLDSAGGQLVSHLLVVADSILNPVATSGPSVANVYVPISLAAGSTDNSFVLTRSGVASTLPVGVVLSSAAQGGNYTGVFGNRFIVRDSLDRNNGNHTTTVLVQTYYPNAANPAGTPIPGGAIASSQSFTGPGPIGLSGLTASGDTITTAETRISTDTINGLGFLLTRNGAPLYISSSPTVAETTPTNFLTSPLFPGFRLNIDTSRVNKYVTGSEFARKGGTDSLPAGVFNSYAVQWDESRSTRRNGATGTYEFTFADDSYGPNAPFTIDFSNPANTQAAVTASLAARNNPTIGDTTAATLAAVRAILGAGIELVPGRIPFTARNTTFGRDVTIAMVKRTTIGDGRTNSILLGNEADTIRVQIDSLDWVPGDYLALIESVSSDSVAGGRVVVDPTTQQPLQAVHQVVTFAPADLACASIRQSCNPVTLATRGATGYLTYTAGTKVYVTYEAGFLPGSQFAIDLTAATTGTSFTAEDRARIRVVPNPYIVQDQYDVVAGRNATARVYFSNVPSAGQLRIYSVSGQFLQQIDWTASDLNGTGDLPYNLRSREGTDLASGLYIWTIKAKDADGKSQLARGKFVVIR